MNNITKTTRFRPKISEINFKGLIRESVDALKNIDFAHRLEVKVTIESCIPFFSDADQLQVILNNIVSNAIRFQHPHEARPVLEIHIETDGEKTLMMFRDNGIGISKEALPKIFDMFYTNPEVKSGGAGLGLYMVKEIVKKLKGKITVESKPNEGTRFQIELPNRIDPDHLRKLNKLIQN